MRQIFDMHLHTNNSDGEFTTGEVVEQLKKYGIKYFSITDHDDIKSIDDIADIDIGDMTYIPGIEISSILDNKYKMHILGYNIDSKNQEICSVVQTLKKARVTRFYELSEQLSKKYGIHIPSEDLNNVIFNNNTPGKPHLAEILVKYGYVKSVKEAFDKYLDGLSTDTSNRIDAKTAIKAIKDSGGIAIWAHPKKVENEYHIDFRSLIPRLRELGIDGIEAYNSLHTLDDCKRYYEFANENNLLVSGGSDYHGINIKNDVKIGVVYNSGEEEKINIENLNIIERNEFYGKN